MLVAVNAYFKIPVGYFLANGLNSEQRVGLVNKCLILCEDNDINVVTLTFDCTSANFSMATKLGANIQYGKVDIIHPKNKNKKVYLYENLGYLAEKRPPPPGSVLVSDQKSKSLQPLGMT